MLRICTRAGLPPYQWRIGSYDHTISYHCALSFVSLGNYCHVHSSVLILFLLLQCHVVLLFLYNTLNFYTVLVLLSLIIVPVYCPCNSADVHKIVYSYMHTQSVPSNEYSSSSCWFYKRMVVLEAQADAVFR